MLRTLGNAIGMLCWPENLFPLACLFYLFAVHLAKRYSKLNEVFSKIQQS